MDTPPYYEIIIQFLPYLPAVAAPKRADSKLSELTVQLNAVGGNVFAAEFSTNLAASNWNVRGEMTFFTNVNGVRVNSAFLTPRGDMSAYKDFLIPLFVLCSLWDPDVIRKMVVPNNPSTCLMIPSNRTGRCSYRVSASCVPCAGQEGPWDPAACCVGLCWGAGAEHVELK